jgi:hypothetical protein
VNVWPEAVTDDTEADLVTDSDGDCVAVTVTWFDAALIAVDEPAGTAEAFAVSLIVPLSMSACVTV